VSITAGFAPVSDLAAGASVLAGASVFSALSLQPVTATAAKKAHPSNAGTKRDFFLNILTGLSYNTTKNIRKIKHFRKVLFKTRFLLW
jgi:hypothetical protein